MDRRCFLTAAGIVPVVAAFPDLAIAQERAFAPAVGPWRTFEVVTKLEIIGSGADTRAWLPVPNVNSDWQHSLGSEWSGNAATVAVHTDPARDARMVYAQWSQDEGAPSLEVVSRVKTRDRVADWKVTTKSVATDVETSLKPTTLTPPTVSFARRRSLRSAARHRMSTKCERSTIGSSRTRIANPAFAVAASAIKAMLETRNMGGKCADLNALFVGLCRSVGVPARDLYGIRVAKSKFPYKELGAGTSDITKAQHCRADVWLQAYGWTAVDPADVAKVMRQETAEWIRSAKHEVVAPVYEGLFGSWEGNWMAYNTAHDVSLPGSKAAVLPFLMYPQAEVKGGRLDSYDPETFKYRITVREVPA